MAVRAASLSSGVGCGVGVFSTGSDVTERGAIGSCGSGDVGGGVGCCGGNVCCRGLTLGGGVAFGLSGIS